MDRYMCVEVPQCVVRDLGHVVVVRASGQAQHDEVNNHPGDDQPLDGHDHLERVLYVCVWLIWFIIVFCSCLVYSVLYMCCFSCVCLFIATITSKIR